MTAFWMGNQPGPHETFASKIAAEAMTETFIVKSSSIKEWIEMAGGQLNERKLNE